MKKPCHLINYRLLLLSVAAITLGFALIALVPSPHGMGVWELTVGPIVVVTGFVLASVAIMHGGKS